MSKETVGQILYEALQKGEKRDTDWASLTSEEKRLYENIASDLGVMVSPDHDDFLRDPKYANLRSNFMDLIHKAGSDPELSSRRCFASSELSLQLVTALLRTAAATPIVANGTVPRLGEPSSEGYPVLRLSRSESALIAEWLEELLQRRKKDAAVERVGLVCHDDGQGDATITICSEERWRQIQAVPFTATSNEEYPGQARYRWFQGVVFYTLEDPADCGGSSLTIPEGLEPARGWIKSVCTQNGVFEPSPHDESLWPKGPYAIIGVLSLCQS